MSALLAAFIGHVMEGHSVTGCRYSRCVAAVQARSDRTLHFVLRLSVFGGFCRVPYKLLGFGAA